MIPNFNVYRKHLLKLYFILCVMVALFAINSILMQNGFGKLNVRIPSIFQFDNAEQLLKYAMTLKYASSRIPTTTIKTKEATNTSTAKLADETILSGGVKDVAKQENMSVMLQRFPWNELEEGAERNKSLYLKHRQNLIDKIEKFAYLEPNTPINSSCYPPDLINSSMIYCERYPDAFLPNKFNHSINIGHAIQLGFDVDTLEIHLNEIYDVVDYFFILESTRIHCEAFRKQLTWDHVNTQPRFNKFRDKVVHLVIDDSEFAQTQRKQGDRQNEWALEDLQERLRWEKIKEWNEYTKAFSENDLIGFGDADEIASRENIQLLKHCPLKSPSIDIGIWFPFGRMDQAFKSDFPISRQLPYTIGDPTYFRWKDIDISMKNFKKETPTRMRGKSEAYLLGGAHLSYYTFLPYFLLRKFSSTECVEFDKKQIKQLFTDPLSIGKGKLDYMEAQFHKRVTHLGNRLRKITDIKEDLSAITKAPWFYDCNKERFPSWEGKHDSRVT